MAALESKLEAAGLPSEASRVAMRDLARLKKMQPSQPEYTVRSSCGVAGFGGFVLCTPWCSFGGFRGGMAILFCLFVVFVIAATIWWPLPKLTSCSVAVPKIVCGAAKQLG